VTKDTTQAFLNLVNWYCNTHVTQ